MPLLLSVLLFELVTYVQSGDWTSRNQNHPDQLQSGKLSKGSHAQTFPRVFEFSFDVALYLLTRPTVILWFLSDLPCTLKIHPSFLAARDVSLFFFFFFSSFSLQRNVPSGEEEEETTVFARYLCDLLGDFIKVVATSASHSGFREWVFVSDHVINLYLQGVVNTLVK